MPKYRLKPGEPYAHRRPSACVINTTVDRDVGERIRELAGSGRKLGTFLAKMLGAYEVELARREERRAIAEALLLSCKDEVNK